MFPRISKSWFLLLLIGSLLVPAAAHANAMADAVSYGGSKHQTPYVSPMDRLLRKIEASIVWKPDPTQPFSRLQINLSENTLYGYQGDKLVASTLVSTGREGHSTRPGHFSVLVKDADHKSNLYGSYCDASGNIVNNQAEAGQPAPAGLHYEAAPMKWYLRLSDDGVGLHAGFVTGYPVSHGCIRLPPTFAQNLFPMVSVGTPVEIVP